MARVHKSRHAAHHAKRRGAKVKAKRAKATVRQAGVRSVGTSHPHFHTVNAPKGW